MNQNGKKKSLMRILALTLALMLVHSVVVTQLGGLSGIARVFAENDPLSRIYSILQGEMGEPETFEDYFQLANIAIGKGEYEDALAYLDKCAELAGEDDSAALTELYLKQASLHMLKQDYDAALPALEAALTHDPANGQALLLRAQIALERGRYSNAADDLERYVKLTPDDVTVRQSLAQVYESTGRYAEAGACYDAIYALRPSEDVHRLNALRCLVLAEDYKSAMSGFDAYLAAKAEADATAATDALLATAYFLRGVCRMRTADHVQAAADFESAMASGYDAGVCLEQLVTCAYASERYEDALAYGKQLLGTQGASPALDALYQQMGVSAMSLSRYEEAVDYLTKSMEANPALVGNAYHRGVSLLSLERYKEAAADFTESIEQDYLTQYCYYNRGVCYVQLLDYDSALDDMEKTLTSGDEKTLKDAATDILWQLAQYYENQRLAQEQQIEAEQIVE